MTSAMLNFTVLPLCFLSWKELIVLSQGAAFHPGVILPTLL